MVTKVYLKETIFYSQWSDYLTKCMAICTFLSMLTALQLFYQVVPQCYKFDTTRALWYIYDKTFKTTCLPACHRIEMGFRNHMISIITVFKWVRYCTSMIVEEVKVHFPFEGKYSYDFFVLFTPFWLSSIIENILKNVFVQV